jgi:hypothetical protein
MLGGGGGGGMWRRGGADVLDEKKMVNDMTLGIRLLRECTTQEERGEWRCVVGRVWQVAILTRANVEWPLLLQAGETGHHLLHRQLLRRTLHAHKHKRKKTT